jgi:N-alpha-acetyltransferase 35, NatC auxiliary subunit
VLLEDIDISEFTKLLQEAHEIVKTESRKTKTTQLLDAISTRLQFRQKFLEVVSISASSPEPRIEDIQQCLTLLPKITETMSLGKEMLLAFSTRIQRRLSIQVPPRPMVSIDPKEATASITTMLHQLIEIEGLYDYKSPTEIIVPYPRNDRLM